MVEVAHEALLRKWPSLRAWLDEAREFLAGKQQLEVDLRDWERATKADNPTRNWLVSSSIARKGGCSRGRNNSRKKNAPTSRRASIKVNVSGASLPGGRLRRPRCLLVSRCSRACNGGRRLKPARRRAISATTPCRRKA